MGILYNLMFQNLIKSLNPNTTSTNQQRQPAPTQDNIFNNYKNNYDHERPFNINLSQNKFDKLLVNKRNPTLQTPHFMDKLNQLGLEFEEVGDEEDVVQGSFPDDEYQTSQKHSQVISNLDLNAEENHPMILSNINNSYKQNINQLSMMKMRQNILEMKNMHKELVDYIEEERSMYEYHQEKFWFQIEDYFIEYRNKILREAGTSNNNDKIKQTINKLQNMVAEKNAQIERLTNQLQKTIKLYKSNDQQNKQLKKSISLKKSEADGRLSFGGAMTNSKLKDQCQNCKSYEQNLINLKTELMQNEKQIDKLLIENEQLQESVFDLQQKIVGVDLEVEKRLKEKSRLISLEAIKSNAKSVNEEHLENIANLNEEIEILQQKCRRYENLSLKENQIYQKEKRLAENQKVYQRKELALAENLAKFQKEKEKNYLREHEILMAEENMAKKIADLRKKQTDLMQKERLLLKKEEEVKMIKKKQLEVSEDYLQGMDDLNRSEEISLKSFGNHKNIYQENNYKLSPQHKNDLNYRQYHEEKYMNKPPDYNYEPIIPAKSSNARIRQQTEYIPRQHERYQRFDHQQRQNSRKFQSRKQIGNIQYHPRSKEKNQMMSKRYPTSSAVSYASNHQPTYGIDHRKNIQQRHNTIHNYNLPSPASNNFREVSKNSRSSASKSIRGHNLQTSNYKSITNSKVNTLPNKDNHLTGLGSKLQRLRQQIKKEIDSIK